MMDPTDRFCFHAIFAIEALKALEAGCPEEDTEFADEINVAIGLRQMLELAVNSYGIQDENKSRRAEAQAALELFFSTMPAEPQHAPG
jgi:hypothetical protein